VKEIAMLMPRRNFLLLAAVAVLPLDERPKRNMLLRSAHPEDLEMPMSGVSNYITPIEQFFVRTHVSVPSINLSEWRLKVEGDVVTPLTLTMDDLKKLPAVELISVLECAGNGRGFYEPSVPGLQWGNGAVGNARWRGVRLADVLKRAGVKESAKEILFDGADVPLGTMPDFQRSISVKKALDDQTLLVYEMNGETLPVKHGFPLRLMAPGWAAAAWVKWLTSIRVLDKEHDGFWMKNAYRHPGKPVPPGTAVPPDQMQPVTSLRVKSVITAPAAGTEVASRKPLTIRGVAWAGDAGPVRAVDVSVDGGRSWKPAALRPDQLTRFGWRQWQFEWTPTQEAYYTILARARDVAGNAQPMDQEWNPSGYGWNVVPRVGVSAVQQPSSTPQPGQSTPSQIAQPSTQAPPTGFKDACGTCHEDDVIRQQRLSRAQWDRELNKMIGWGAKVRDEDRNTFLDYLLRSYGPGPGTR
jgi:DMSO/TMAO reductase YedYZ molybdopterin-dependent catalytic subunit